MRALGEGPDCRCGRGDLDPGGGCGRCFHSPASRTPQWRQPDIWRRELRNSVSHGRVGGCACVPLWNGMFLLILIPLLPRLLVMILILLQCGDVKVQRTCAAYNVPPHVCKLWEEGRVCRAYGQSQSSLPFGSRLGSAASFSSRPPGPFSPFNSFRERMLKSLLRQGQGTRRRSLQCEGVAMRVLGEGPVCR